MKPFIQLKTFLKINFIVKPKFKISQFKYSQIENEIRKQSKTFICIAILRLTENFII